MYLREISYYYNRFEGKCKLYEFPIDNNIGIRRGSLTLAY